MSKKNTNLGGLGGNDDYGDVDLFGLDEFGAPVGLNPVWGAMTGGAVSTGAAIAVRQWLPEYHGWSEGIGAAAGVLAGAVMAFFPGTRAAGWTGMAVAVTTAGLRQAEKLLVGDAVDYYGLPSVSTPYYAGVEIEPLGIATTEDAMTAGADAQLLGQSPAQLVGAENMLLARHFGATVFGSNN